MGEGLGRFRFHGEWLEGNGESGEEMGNSWEGQEVVGNE